MANIEVAIRKSADKKITYSLNIAYAEDPTLVSRLDELNGEVIGVTSSAKIAAAIDSKEAIAGAVNGKGGNITADTPLSDYAEEIQALTVSVVGKPSDGPRVRFFDYDGTLLKTQYVPKGGAATAPEIPQHERLLFQEWNNDFDNITRDKDVGAIYTTKSGASEFDFYVKGSLSITIRLNVKTAGVQVDWGDGVIEELSTTGTYDHTHTYTTAGMYTVKVTGNWTNSTQIVRSGLLMAAHICGTLFSVSHALNNIFVKQITFDKNSNCRGSTYFLSASKCLCHLNFPRGFQSYRYWGMQGLRTVSLPDDFRLEYSMFTSSLFQTVVLPEQTETIPYACFDGSKLEFITIPPNVTFIDGLSFRQCECLYKITLEGENPPSLAADAFTNANGLAEIIVPKGCAEAYKTATNWSTYADIIKEQEND